MKSYMLRGVLLVLAIMLSVSTLGQTSSPNSSTNRVLLTVDGDVDHPLKLSADDLKKLPRRSIKAKDHDGKEGLFEGIEVGEILKLAGVKSGEALRGKEMTLFVVVDAADGYRALLALPETDHSFTDRIMLLADHRDGKLLDDKEGPLRLVIPDEKRQGRWVRQVTSLTVRYAR